MISILEPLLVRLRQRKVCFSCGGKATRKCLTHGTRPCEDVQCRMDHRRVKSAVYGSLTRPFCEFRLLNNWADHALHSLLVIVVGVTFAWILVWL